MLRICPARTPRHLDGVTAPTDRVLICRAGVDFSSDGVSTYGPWEVADLIPHPTRLLAAYRAPDAPIRTSGCATTVQDPLLIWIARGGIVTEYAAPVDGCGDPQRAAATAYRAAVRAPLVDIDTGQPGYRPGKE